MRLTFVMPVVAILALSVLAGCDGAEGRKQKYLTQASTNFESGDYEKARINYKNVLQIDPKDINGREGYAKTLEKLQDWRGAVAQYRGIIEDFPDNVDAKIKLGQLYLLAKAADLALPLADEVLASNDSNDSALALKSGAFMQFGKSSEALALAEKSYQINSESLDNIVLLASIYSSQKRVDDAIALLEHEVLSHSNSNSIHTLLAQLYLSSGNKVSAEREMKILVDNNPAEIGYKSQLARFYDASGRGEEAEKLLIDAMQLQPEKVEPVFALHSFYMQRKQIDKAESILKDASFKNPENNELKLHLAGFYLAQKRAEEARTIYTDLLKKDNGTMLKAKSRLAYMATLDGKPDDAMRLLGEVLQDNPADVEAHTLRGGIYLSQHNAVDAINDLRAVLAATPDAPEIIKLLGKAHQMNGEMQQAVDLFKSALNLQPRDLDLRLHLSDLLVQTKEINQAAKQLELADKLVPNNELILEKMVKVYLQGQLLDDADSAITKLKLLNPTSPRNPYYSGLVLQSRKLHEKAKVEFDTALALKPGAIEPMTAKVKSYIALDQIDEALEWLGKNIDSIKENPVAHNLMGELWLAKKDWKKAEASFAQAIEIKSEWWIPYRNMALTLHGEGSEQKAYEYLMSVVDRADSVPLRIELANYADRLQQYDTAIDQYEKALKQNQNNNVIANNLAMLIVSHKTDTESLARAAELSRQLESLTDPSFLDTAGWVNYTLGDYQKALPIIQQAARIAPEDPSIQYHLAMVYWETSDKQNAERFLKKALESDKPFMGRDQAVKLLAEISQQS